MFSIQVISPTSPPTAFPFRPSGRIYAPPSPQDGPTTPFQSIQNQGGSNHPNLSIRLPPDWALPRLESPRTPTGFTVPLSNPNLPPHTSDYVPFGYYPQSNLPSNFQTLSPTSVPALGSYNITNFSPLRNENSNPWFHDSNSTIGGSTATWPLKSPTTFIPTLFSVPYAPNVVPPPPMPYVFPDGPFRAGNPPWEPTNQVKSNQDASQTDLEPSGSVSSTESTPNPRASRGFWPYPDPVSQKVLEETGQDIQTANNLFLLGKLKVFGESQPDKEAGKVAKLSSSSRNLPTEIDRVAGPESDSRSNVIVLSSTSSPLNEREAQPGLSGNHRSVLGVREKPPAKKKPKTKKFRKTKKRKWPKSDDSEETEEEEPKKSPQRDRNQPPHAALLDQKSHAIESDDQSDKISEQRSRPSHKRKRESDDDGDSDFHATVREPPRMVRELRASTLAKSRFFDDTIKPSMPVCTEIQVMNRGSGRATPELWTPEQSATLVKLVKNTSFKSWKAISDELNRIFNCSKTAGQCHQRYRRVADPSIRHGPWSKEEDEKLLSLTKLFGLSWSAISKQIPGRPDVQCRRRYQKLVPNYRQFMKSLERPSKGENGAGDVEPDSSEPPTSESLPQDSEPEQAEIDQSLHLAL